MMKVAIVNQPMDMLIPPHQNSIGLWSYNAAPFLAQTWDVHVFGKRNAAQRAWDGQPGVTYSFMPPVVPNRALIDRLEGPYNRMKKERLPIYASRLYYLDYIAQVAWQARRKRVDMVHIHNFTQFVPVVRAICPQAKIALHMNCEWLNQLDREVMGQRMAQADLVFGSSDYITQLAQQTFPEMAARCHTVYNGVDPDLFYREDGVGDAPGREQRLLFVGRVSPEKGVHDLVAAFPLVASQFPDAHLDIVGPISVLPLEFIVGVSDDPYVAGLSSLYDEEYGAYLRRLVPPELVDRVHFHGGLPQKDVVQHYQRASILVNPSYSESFGMSLVEALASKVPVIATRVGGMVNILEDGVTGYFVDRADVAGLADTISGLLRDEALRQRMGDTGREQILRRFSWAGVAQKVLDCYATVLPDAQA